jgi:hypothetical protein
VVADDYKGCTVSILKVYVECYKTKVHEVQKHVVPFM